MSRAQKSEFLVIGPSYGETSQVGDHFDLLLKLRV
jgi:hypothetical protein